MYKVKRIGVPDLRLIIGGVNIIMDKAVLKIVLAKVCNNSAGIFRSYIKLREE